MKSSTDNTSKKIKVGLSACLAGFEVRYNGGHCKSSLCMDTLSQHFEYVTFCPELAAGFGTPRPTMRLIGHPNSPTLTYNLNTECEQLDLTQKLLDGFTPKLAEFEELDAYILMKSSPSCGMGQIKVYQENGSPHELPGQGIFAAALQKQYPNLPIEEEARLHDDQLYENFILRVYAYHNFRHEVLKQPSVHKLLQFHSSYKYVLMAHSQTHYQALGKSLANIDKHQLDQILIDYQHEFMQALGQCASRENHTNTLMHILGYLKKTVATDVRQDINQIILKYHRGDIPLDTPLTLLKHHIKQSGSEYIRTQRYLEPYPQQLGLANHM